MKLKNKVTSVCVTGLIATGFAFTSTPTNAREINFDPSNYLRQVRARLVGNKVLQDLPNATIVNSGYAACGYISQGISRNDYTRIMLTMLEPQDDATNIHATHFFQAVWQSANDSLCTEERGT